MSPTGIVAACAALLPSLASAEGRLTADNLKSMPAVIEVTVRSAKQPTHRVIHILGWHYVPKKQFVLDAPDGDYEAFLDDIEALQNPSCGRDSTVVRHLSGERGLNIKPVLLGGLPSSG